MTRKRADYLISNFSKFNMNPNKIENGTKDDIDFLKFYSDKLYVSIMQKDYTDPTDIESVISEYNCIKRDKILNEILVYL